MTDLMAEFESGYGNNECLSDCGTPSQRQRWDDDRNRIKLTDTQKSVLAGFQRTMNVLVVAGTWCGDCVEQCPIFQVFAGVTDRIQVRYVDRDAHEDLAQMLSICGGLRVPVVVFLSEDGYECGRYGDRTLSKYRQMAATLSGPACSSGVVSDASPVFDGVVQDWLNEFERIQLMLQTSPRLRQL